MFSEMKTEAGTTPGLLIRQKNDSGAFADVRVERAPVRGKEIRLNLVAAA